MGKFRRVRGWLIRVPLGLVRRHSPQPATVEVAFRLTDHRNIALGGVAIRLVLGQGDWADPETGTRLTTDREGCATVTVAAVIDRRWRRVNIGFTPFGIPLRADRLAVAVELPQHVPLPDGEIILPRLYWMEVYRFKSGTCSTYGIERVYATDEDGRFTRILDPRVGITIPGSPAKLFGIDYRNTDFGLDPVEGKPWRLSLGFARGRPPVVH